MPWAWGGENDGVRVEGDLIVMSLVSLDVLGCSLLHWHISCRDESLWSSASRASSSAIAMAAALDGAILSLHPWHEKQHLLLFSALFVWPHHWHCHNPAVRSADFGIGISPRWKISRVRRALALTASPAKNKGLIFQSVELILFYMRSPWF